MRNHCSKTRALGADASDCAHKAYVSCCCISKSGEDLTDQSLITRRYEPGDELGISKLMEIVFSRSYSSVWLRHFRWQQTNPFGRNIRWVTEHKGEIVGHIVRTPLPIKLGDQVPKGSIAADAATLPEFRRQGVYRALSESSWEDALQNHIPISYADASRMSISPARKYGILDVSEIAVMINLLNPREIVEKRFGRSFLAKTVSHGVESAFRVLPIAGRKVEAAQFRMTRVTAFDDRFDAFWNEISRFHGICIVRSKEYLNWKYFERTHLSFDVLAAEVGDRILGYTVLSTRIQGDIKKGLIFELMTHPDREDVMDFLFSQAVEHFRKNGVDYAECWTMKNSPCYRPLRKHGFFASALFPKSTLVVRYDPSKVSEQLVKRVGQWCIAFGDFL